MMEDVCPSASAPSAPSALSFLILTLPAPVHLHTGLAFAFAFAFIRLISFHPSEPASHCPPPMRHACHVSSTYLTCVPACEARREKRKGGETRGETGNKAIPSLPPSLSLVRERTPRGWSESKTHELSALLVCEVRGQRCPGRLRSPRGHHRNQGCSQTMHPPAPSHARLD